jgi:hypothetical protein
VSWVIATFDNKDSLTKAIRALRAAGSGIADLDIFSEEPVELAHGVLDRPSKMSLTAVLTAITTGALATGFVYFAQNDYRIQSGGMPYFSFWSSGVITYELTMLGSILAIFGAFLWESRLFRKKEPGAPVPECPPNAICLRVRCDAAKTESTADALRRNGAEVRPCE